MENPTGTPCSLLRRQLNTALALAVLLAALCSCVQLPIDEHPTVQVAPYFSDNMVLQQGSTTRIWGTARPNAGVWVNFKGKTARTKVDRAGVWTVQLDLRQPLDPLPGELLIGQGRGTEPPAIVLTNVVTGSVWLLGVCTGKGVAKLPEQTLPSRAHFIRFTTATDLGEISELGSGTVAPWRVCSADSIDAGEFSALSYYFAVNLHVSSGGYLGIVQTRPNSLAGGLRQSAALNPDRLDFRQNAVLPGLVGAWDPARQEVRQGQEMRLKRIKMAADSGIRLNLPEITQYDLADFPHHRHLREEFSTSRLPASLLTFDGAIW